MALSSAIRASEPSSCENRAPTSPAPSRPVTHATCQNKPSTRTDGKMIAIVFFCSFFHQIPCCQIAELSNSTCKSVLARVTTCSGLQRDAVFCMVIAKCYFKGKVHPKILKCRFFLLPVMLFTVSIEMVLGLELETLPVNMSAFSLI